MTRDRIPPGPVLQTAYGILDKFKISRTFFVKTDQEGCALAASDINAANGITSISTVAEATGYEQKHADEPKPQEVGEMILNNAEDQEAGTTPEADTNEEVENDA